MGNLTTSYYVYNFFMHFFSIQIPFECSLKRGMIAQTETELLNLKNLNDCEYYVYYPNPMKKLQARDLKFH